MNNHPSSSRFTEWLTPSLHELRRRVSAQYIDRSVMISMGTEAAGSTVERRLALAAFTVNGSAGRTGLRGIGGIAFQQMPAAFFEFVGKDGFEGIPALIQYRSVKSGFGKNVYARRVSRALGTRCHTADLQIFKHDAAEPLRDAQGGLVVPVATDPGSPSRQAGAAPQLPRPAPRTALAARKDALCGTVTPVDGPKADRDGKPLTGRKGQGIGDAAINPNAWADVGRRLVFDGAGEVDVPTTPVFDNGYVLHIARKGTRRPEHNPADFGYAYLCPLAVDIANLRLASLEAEALVFALATRFWIARFSRKERFECAVKIPKGLILGCTKYGGNPIKLLAQFRQLSTLGGITNAPPFRCPELPIKVSALFESQVVDEPTHATELPKQQFLLICRLKPVAKCAENHTQNILEFSEVGNGARTP